MYKAVEIAEWLIYYNEMKREFEDEDTDYISNLKLQKLLFYAQSAFLAIKGCPLFEEEVEAWKHGPVIVNVYEKYKRYGASGITEYDSEIASRIKQDRETTKILEEVYDIFAEYSAWGLRNLTHSEEPWQSTQLGFVISRKKMLKTFKEKYLED